LACAASTQLVRKPAPTGSVIAQQHSDAVVAETADDVGVPQAGPQLRSERPQGVPAALRAPQDDEREQGASRGRPDCARGRPAARRPRAGSTLRCPLRIDRRPQGDLLAPGCGQPVGHGLEPADGQQATDADGQGHELGIVVVIQSDRSRAAHCGMCGIVHVHSPSVAMWSLRGCVDRGKSKRTMWLRSRCSAQRHRPPVGRLSVSASPRRGSEPHARAFWGPKQAVGPSQHPCRADTSANRNCAVPGAPSHCMSLAVALALGSPSSRSCGNGAHLLVGIVHCSHPFGSARTHGARARSVGRVSASRMASASSTSDPGVTSHPQ
jgi:hypothetical protein